MDSSTELDQEYEMRKEEDMVFSEPKIDVRRAIRNAK